MKKPVFSKETGFTLVELMVVVIIIGVLASIAIPRYAKSLEQAKADDSVAFVRMIGNTNRMFRLDNNFYATGVFPSTCSGVCGAPFAGPAAACELIYCRYLASQDWGGKPYTFYAIDGDSPTTPCGGGAADAVACAKRCTGPSPCTNTSPYKNWAYYMDINGKLTAAGGAPPPPSGI